MSSEFWLTLLGAVGASSLVPAAITVYQNRQALRAAAPRESADVSATNLEAQGKTVDRLSVENDRLSKKLEEANKRMDQMQRMIDKVVADLENAQTEQTADREAEEEFRRRVEQLLAEKDIPTPDWWNAYRSRAKRKAIRPLQGES